MTNKPSEPAKPRKPYHTPVLEYLGSIRDLTLGTATTGPPDAKSRGQRGT
jgi:hypothetical protein